MKRPTTEKELNTVYNLSDDTEILTYIGCTQREKVIAAYAQSQGDYNTADYSQKYSELVKWGANSVSCVNYCAFRNPKDADDNNLVYNNILIVADKMKVPSSAE